MNDTKIILSSLAMDLKRVALGLNRGSQIMAARFAEEALARKRELNIKKVHPYLAKLLIGVETSLAGVDNRKKSEDALMYSTLLQNYSATLS